MSGTDDVVAPAFVSIEKAAPMLDIDPSTYYSHLRAGTFPFPQITTKVGGRWKTSLYKLDQFKRGELADPSAIEVAT